MIYPFRVSWSTDPNRDDCSFGDARFVRESDARNYARMIERDIPGAKVTVNTRTSFPDPQPASIQPQKDAQ